MKKVIAILTALTLALGMTACAGKDNSSTLKVGDLTTTAPADVSGTDDSSAESDVILPDSVWWDSMFLYVYDENGKIKYCEDPGFGTAPLDEGFKITFPIELNYNAEGVDNEIDANVYVICDGHLIKHSFDENAEPTEKSAIKLRNAVEETFDLYIPPTELGDFEQKHMWVCIVTEPDYAFKSPAQEVELFLHSSLAVKSTGGEIEYTSVYEAQEKDYIDGISASIDYAVNIGEYTGSTPLIQDNGGAAAEKPQIDSDSDFAVTAYLDDLDYYLAVFCDGELMNAFDGKPFMKVNCRGENGARSVKYSLDKDILPENGEHTFSVIALPNQIRDDALDYGSVECSNRHTIIINM